MSMTFDMPASQKWVQSGMSGMVEFGDDNKKFVVFYDKTIHNPAKSAAAGRPECDVVTYVRIQDPGDNLQIADRPARPDDAQRWPQHFRNYQEGRGTEQPGTPIELLFPANPELVYTFRHMKVTTVQALASLEGTSLQAVGMGAEEFKIKARKYLEMSKDGEAFTKMEAALVSRDMEIAALKQQNTEITERLDKMLKMMEANAAGAGTAAIEPGPKVVPPRRAPMGTGEI
jgi:hypothetical protein